MINIKGTPVGEEEATMLNVITKLIGDAKVLEAIYAEYVDMEDRLYTNYQITYIPNAKLAKIAYVILMDLFLFADKDTYDRFNESVIKVLKNLELISKVERLEC